jgi:integrase
MSRQKYQRPEVKLWKGKAGGKFWKAQWFQYIEGRPKPKHRAATWPCADYTKAKAQEACDRLVREETGTQRADGSMTVADFWQKVYFPTASHRLAPNSRLSYFSSYRVYVEPAIGKMELQYVPKAIISGILDKMADAGRALPTVTAVLNVINELFEEALENNYVTINPARKVTIPRCTESKETRPLDEAEVRRIFESTSAFAYMIWRILFLTGCRIGEVLALTRDDLLPEGFLRIDESALHGKPAHTKSRKIRIAPIPDSLQAEIEEWAAKGQSPILFPTPKGNLYRRSDPTLRAILSETRIAAGIPDLAYRMGRATYATLYRGDLKDLQAILGHSTIETTAKFYKKAISERQRASAADLDSRYGNVVSINRKKDSA